MANGFGVSYMCTQLLSHVQLFATPWTLPARLLCPWDSPGKNTQKNCTKKELHNQDNHDDVITHLEPDIQECEVKWALGSITMNKARGGDGIPVELFQILKDDAVKVLHSICQQI